jgi:hypothetical protein
MVMEITEGAHVAQSVEHLHGKQAVSSSNLLVGSIFLFPEIQQKLVAALEFVILKKILRGHDG